MCSHTPPRWIANFEEEDQSKDMLLVCRSLACQRLELQRNRHATRSTLANEWERRQQKNSEAVDAINSNRELWMRACRGKIDPDDLIEPTPKDLQECQNTVETLQQMLRTHGASGGFDSQVEELEKSVKQLKVVSWEAIRIDKFNITPPEMYSELIQGAQFLLCAWNADAARRAARMKAPLDANFGAHADADEEEEEALLPQEPLRPRDKFGLDIDGQYRRNSMRKFKGHQEAIKATKEVLIDYMRGIMDIHYDEVCSEAAPERKRTKRGDVYPSFTRAYREQLCQHLRLPQKVKELMRKPEHDTNPAKLEQLLAIVQAEMEGETEMFLGTRDEIQALAKAVASCKSRKYPTEIGATGTNQSASFLRKFPVGARIVTETKGSVATARKTLVAEIRNLSEGDSVIVKTRPMDSSRAPLLDHFSERMMRATTLEDIRSESSTPIDAEEMRNYLLLSLWDALFLAQAEWWTANDVANTTAANAWELGMWFHRGMKLGKKPLFDGLCAFCGALLHSDGHTGNTVAGVPLNRDGVPTNNADAQPPFLLRYSPAEFQKECPALFAWDPSTNRLCLREGKTPPWRRGEQWRYCDICAQTYLPGRAQRGKARVPFRDKASQNEMRSNSQYLARDEMQPARFVAADSHREAALPEETAPPEGEEAAAADPEEESPSMPDEPEPPTLQEYQAKWTVLKAYHERSNEDAFSEANLVPRPISQLWQDCPHVPFAELKSEEAQARLSVCRPATAFTEASFKDGTPRYAHISGSQEFQRRATWQLASTMGFVVGKNRGLFLSVSEKEKMAVHECLQWGRQPNNNKQLDFYSTVFESWLNASEQLMGKLRAVIPQGSNRVRVRASKRESHGAKVSTLRDTLGDEESGLVVLDPSCVPTKYDQMQIWSNIIGTSTARLQVVDYQEPRSQKWRKARNHTIDLRNIAEFDESWRNDITAGTKHIMKNAWVAADDPHIDAKLFVPWHPYGTGSYLSESTSCGLHRLAKSRLMALQRCFRASSSYGFWFLNRTIISELFFREQHRRKVEKRFMDTGEKDHIKRLFGTVVPSSIIESTEWWRMQQKNLFAISDQAELGVMNQMVTLTTNDAFPELVATIQRGPGAVANESEQLEFLTTRKRAPRAPAEKHSLESVICYQRRVAAIKAEFFTRGKPTPLGEIRDSWDRTEAQKRGALHQHILVWYLPRELHPEYTPLRPVQRTVKGNDSKQRHRSHVVEPLPANQYQEDQCYHTHKIARVVAEMTRPSVKMGAEGPRWGGHCVYSLRFAGLARCFQARFLIHQCTSRYCLLNRNSCRFFFPWPKQPHQLHDENTDRIALQRRLESDDQWLSPSPIPHTMHIVTIVVVILLGKLNC